MRRNQAITPKTAEGKQATALFLFDLLNTKGGQGFDGIKTAHKAILNAVGEALGGWEKNKTLIRACYGDLFPWRAPGMVPTLQVLEEVVGIGSNRSIQEVIATVLKEGMVPFALGMGPLKMMVVQTADRMIRSCVGSGYLGVAYIKKADFWEIASELRLLTELEVKADSARGQWYPSHNELHQMGLKRGHRTTTVRSK